MKGASHVQALVLAQRVVLSRIVNPLLFAATMGVLGCSDSSGGATSNGAGTSGTGNVASIAGGSSSGGASGGASPVAGSTTTGGSVAQSGMAGMQSSTGGVYVPLWDGQCSVGANLDGARFDIKLKEPLEPRRFALRIEWASTGAPCSVSGLLYQADRSDTLSDAIGFSDTAVTSWEDGALFVRVPEDDGLARDIYDIGIGIQGCNEGYVWSDLRKDATPGPGTLIADCNWGAP